MAGSGSWLMIFMPRGPNPVLDSWFEWLDISIWFSCWLLCSGHVLVSWPLVRALDQSSWCHHPSSNGQEFSLHYAKRAKVHGPIILLCAWDSEEDLGSWLDSEDRWSWLSTVLFSLNVCCALPNIYGSPFFFPFHHSECDGLIAKSSCTKNLELKLVVIS